MELIPSAIEVYAQSFSTPETELLLEINRKTYADHEQPHMLSGHLQGNLLKMISLMIKPKWVLEIGTFTGYSAICLAEGLQSEGQLHTIELRPEDAELSAGYFARSAFAGQIISHTGNALDIIPKLQYEWDLVFIDADKPNYIEYYNLVLPQLKKGGFILADNVLFHGQVLENPVTGKNAKAIQAFNEYIRNDSRVEQVLLTIRDGLMLIRKK